MADVEVKYENTTVTTVRGAEARSIAKWETQGWEFVSQTPAKLLRTTLLFRRPKKQTPRWAWIAGGAVLLVAIIGITIGALTEAHGDPDAAASPSASISANDAPSVEPSPTPTTAPVATVAPTSAPTDSTASGLQWTWAWTTCEAYGKQQFPYGYDDSLGGLYAKEIQGDTWWLKYQATVANGYGAKQDVDVECTVGGSNDAPTVVSFISY